VDVVKNESARINSDLNIIDASLSKFDEEHRKRKLAGAAAVIGALLAAVILYLLCKSYD
jgi:hypothetical protein